MSENGSMVCVLLGVVLAVTLVVCTAIVSYHWKEITIIKEGMHWQPYRGGGWVSREEAK